MTKNTNSSSESAGTNTINVSCAAPAVPNIGSCAEEYYMGVSASYEAYSVSVPTALIPPALLSIIQEKINNKRITGIAIMK